MKETTRGLVAIAILSLATYAGAQTKSPITISGADTAAAASANSRPKHALAARTAAGANFKEKLALPGPPTVPFVSNPSRWLGDLSYQGGPYLQSAEMHAIYVLNSPTVGAPGCTPATITQCWSTPETFLANMGKSEFIHITDQYVQTTANLRYTVGGNAEVYFTPSLPHELTDADILAVVHLVVSVLGYQNGYNGIFHVFLPPGTDECFDSTFSVCYSPDIPNSFAYCAYHASVIFPDIGETLYSVEPAQNVPGCNAAPNGPQGQLADSTNTILSHETIEAITDPDGDAWWNTADNSLFGQEIGDECQFLAFTPGGEYWGLSIVRMNGVKYAIQPEYSNSGHACRTSMSE